MVQVQSTWFPLIDRNPQKFVPSIYAAKAEDFVTATQRIYTSRERGRRTSCFRSCGIAGIWNLEFGMRARIRKFPNSYFLIPTAQS